MHRETTVLTRYDTTRSYQWNYDHAPDPVDLEIPEVPGDWRFCGLRVASPLGIPAGPLLNGKWCLYYASLGFDVLTYKTVRSAERPCYPLPNLQPVDCGPLHGGERELPAAERMRGSWAVSFGMPSKDPATWRRDIEATRKKLSRGKLLSVSVVGTVGEGASLDELAADYARCARWALDSGADCIETNFSCPNVSTRDGQLYQETCAAREVAVQVRQSIGAEKYIIKIGHVRQEEEARRLVEALAPLADALAMTNSVAATVRDASGHALFDGQPRGICGGATRMASLEQTKMFANVIRGRDDHLDLVGVGGISTAEHVRDYLRAGARAVHLATSPMVDPHVGIAIRSELAATLAG